MEGRAWNEAYVVRAFLMFNTEFRIVLWLNYLVLRHGELIKQLAPLATRNVGGSLWLRRRTACEH